MNEKEAIAVLESIRREIDQCLNCSCICTKRAALYWKTEIEAIDMGIEALQNKE